MPCTTPAGVTDGLRIRASRAPDQVSPLGTTSRPVSWPKATTPAVSRRGVPLRFGRTREWRNPVDAPDLGSGARKGVGVQLPPLAPSAPPEARDRLDVSVAGPVDSDQNRRVTADRSSRPKRLLLLFAGLLLIAAPVAAVAQEQALGGKFRSGDEVIVSTGETVAGDLYAASGTVRIDGTVEGDLVVAGGTVEVDGRVEGDVLAACGGLHISGEVGGDVRVGAGDVTVAGSIGEDLVTGAGQVAITSSGTVGEDLVFGAGEVMMDGRIDGDVLGATGSYTRRGTVGGTEDVSIGEREEREPTFGERALGALRRLIALAVVAGLLLWLFPWSIEATATTLRRRPWASLGFGAIGFGGLIVAVFAILIAAILLALILGLLTLGELVAFVIFTCTVAIIVLAFVVVVVFAYVAPAAVGMAVASLARMPTDGARRWAALAAGVLAVVIVTSVPVIGGWLGFLIVIFGFGAFLLAANARRRRTTATPPAPPPPPMPLPTI